METNFNYGIIGLILLGIWFIMTCLELFIDIETDKNTELD